jgi:hypothetical protein
MTLELIIETASTLALFITLVFIYLQFKRDISVNRFRIHDSLNDKYLDLLWRATEDSALNDVWQALPPERNAELSAAQDAERWGAWKIMTEAERRLYRFTRLSLEVQEHACRARREGWIDESAWNKWRGTMEIWLGSCMFDYAYKDARDRMDASFCGELERLRNA